MKLIISRSSASAAAGIAIIVRIFCGLMIDSANLYNSAWLCVPLGSIIAFPLLFALRQVLNSTSDGVSLYSGNDSHLKRPIIFILLFISWYDGSFALKGIANSASYIGFQGLSPIYLMIPAFIAGFLCICCNGEAIGYGARIWSMIAPVFLVIIIAIQLPNYHLSWLTPVLGFGWSGIAEGSLKTAGWISSMSAAFLIAENDSQDRTAHSSPTKLLLYIAAISGLLIVTQLMMSPSLVFAPSRSRLYQLDTLLTNGRSVLSLQFPMIIIWFTGMLFLWAYNCFIASALLQRAFPRLNGHICGMISILISALLTPYTERDIEDIVSRWQFTAIGLSVAMVMMFRMRGGKACKD